MDCSQYHFLATGPDSSYRAWYGATRQSRYQHKALISDLWSGRPKQMLLQAISGLNGRAPRRRCLVQLARVVNLL